MKKKKLYIASAVLTIVSLLGFVLSAVLIDYNIEFWWTMLISTILFNLLFVLTCWAYFPNAEFICIKCNKQFKPTVTASLIAYHTITRRYLKCSHCNQKS